MRILAIDTSCDETAAAVTEDTKILSNIIWSQASLHAHWGGVVPSLAQRKHEERIDFVIEKALKSAFPQHTTYDILHTKIDAIAVTVGPGLSIALGVGIDRAKKLAEKYGKPLIPVNHVEAHLLSSISNSNFQTQNSKQILNTKSKILNIKFPAFGLVVSGGNTMFVLIEKIGQYEILAETQDDALGEALDKAARLLGFGYPGGAVLEKIAKEGDITRYKLPTPLETDKIKNRFSYSGLKTAFMRLVGSIKDPSKKEIADLAAVFQETAFKHITRVLDYQITKSMENGNWKMENLLFGGGVANNIYLRKRLRELCKKHGLKLLVPYSKRLLGDNAAMIGVCAYLKNMNQKLGAEDFLDYSKIDRNPKLKLDK